YSRADHHSAREGTMSHGMRGQRRRAGMHRRTMSDWSVESLEARTLLSHAVGSAEVAALPAQRATTTLLQSSTKVTGAGQRVTLVATVRSTNANWPVTAGQVRFSIVSSAHTVLGV